MQDSIVEYFSKHEAYKCGYCKTSGCFSHGMWAHCLNPIDYQNLIDRGWRRSGKYCYKPTMDKTCCPQYTIRCDASKFVPTKSQKKVLKRMQRFLSRGEGKPDANSTSCKAKDGEDMDLGECPQDQDIQRVKKVKVERDIQQSDIKGDDREYVPENQSEASMPLHPSQADQSSEPDLPKESAASSKSASGSPCRKAKVVRQEHKLQKLLKKGVSPEDAAEAIKKKGPESKTLEEFLAETPDAVHKLELHLVSSSADPCTFNKSFEESFYLYKKYQTSVHSDTVERCSTDQYTRFLVTTPIQDHKDDGSPVKYGSYHQHYRLDGKLIAVGVLDILPWCVSSVYLYYDPEYSFLSLGVYSALREIALVRKLSKMSPDLHYYYMGYYIHSCVKMRYKGQYFPSFLLCPETYIFQPIEKCKPKLDVSKYSRLEEDPTKEADPDGKTNLAKVQILYQRRRMTYARYRSRANDSNDEEEVLEYANFVGRKCYSSMLLYRASA